MCRMPRVTWREQDIGDLQEGVADEQAVRDTLAECGMLKFFEIPLIRSTKLLLDKESQDHAHMLLFYEEYFIN